MGFAKRSFEPKVEAEPDRGAIEEDIMRNGGELGRCTSCRAMKTDPDASQACLEHCQNRGSGAPCSECWAAECADCLGMLCPECKLLAVTCGYCGAPFCRGGACGSPCVDCASMTCEDCAIAVYDQTDTRRRCLHCAVARPGRKPEAASEVLLGTPAPSTPPRRTRDPFLRAHSAEKLPAAPRLGRGRAAAQLRPSAAPSQEGRMVVGNHVGSALPQMDVSHMRSRARSDAKYWAQIQAAHRLLTESTAAELQLSERLQAQGGVLEPVFQELQSQEGIRLSAVAMLEILSALVSELEREAPRPGQPTEQHPAAAAAQEHSQEAVGVSSPSTPKAPAQVGASSPGTPKAAASAGTPSTPQPRRRRQRALEMDLTPTPVVRSRKSRKTSEQPAGHARKC